MEAGGLTLFSYVGQGCSMPGLANPGLMQILILVLQI